MSEETKQNPADEPEQSEVSANDVSQETESESSSEQQNASGADPAAGASYAPQDLEAENGAIVRIDVVYPAWNLLFSEFIRSVGKRKVRVRSGNVIPDDTRFEIRLQPPEGESFSLRAFVYQSETMMDGSAGPSQDDRGSVSPGEITVAIVEDQSFRAYAQAITLQLREKLGDYVAAKLLDPAEH